MMKSRTTFFILLVTISVLISTATDRALSQFGSTQRRSEVLQVKALQLVDHRLQVRCTLGLVEIFGHAVPQLTMRDEAGHVALVLQLNETGNGTLFFNSRDKEGKLAVGYLLGSDVVGRDGYVIDKADSLSAWGIRVLGPGTRSIALGFANAGSPVFPR